MSKQLSFWDLEDRLNEISPGGDPLEALSAAVDFERFRPILEKAASEIWSDASAKAAQNDTDVRWMVKHKKAKAGPDGRKLVDIAVPVYGCKSYISIDRVHGIIRRQIAADAAAQDGDRLREGLIDRGNICDDVWADTACRSAENEIRLKENGLNSRIHRKKPRGRPMNKRTAKANGCIPFSLGQAAATASERRWLERADPRRTPFAGLLQSRRDDPG